MFDATKKELKASEVLGKVVPEAVRDATKKELKDKHLRAKGALYSLDATKKELKGRPAPLSRPPNFAPDATKKELKVPSLLNSSSFIASLMQLRKN